MKKFLFILMLVGVVVWIIYLLLGSDSNEQTSASYVEFSPLQPEITPGESVSLDVTDILKDNISPELDRVVNSIYRDNYYVLECSEEIGGGRAMILTAKYDGSVSRDGYERAYQEIKNWEKNAVAEIGHIIFPSLGEQTASVNFVWFEPYQVNNPHITASRDFHKALFYIGETPYELHYGWVLNYVIFASSQECLEATMEALYGTH